MQSNLLIPDSVIIPLSMKYADLYSINGIHSAILALYSNVVKDSMNKAACRLGITNFSFWQANMASSNSSDHIRLYELYIY